MKKELKRVCKDKERYYVISLYQTLFGYFCIERIYGASKNKSHTGRIRDFFNELEEAQEYFFSIMKAKKSKGYHE